MRGVRRAQSAPRAPNESLNLNPTAVPLLAGKRRSRAQSPTQIRSPESNVAARGSERRFDTGGRRHTMSDRAGEPHGQILPQADRHSSDAGVVARRPSALCALVNLGVGGAGALGGDHLRRGDLELRFCVPDELVRTAVHGRLVAGAAGADVHPPWQHCGAAHRSLPDAGDFCRGGSWCGRRC